jgi:hypothetical protein
VADEQLTLLFFDVTFEFGVNTILVTSVGRKLKVSWTALGCLPAVVVWVKLSIDMPPGTALPGLSESPTCWALASPERTGIRTAKEYMILNEHI